MMQSIVKQDPRDKRKIWIIKRSITGSLLANHTINGKPSKEPDQLIQVSTVAVVLGVTPTQIEEWLESGQEEVIAAAS